MMSKGAGSWGLDPGDSAVIQPSCSPEMRRRAIPKSGVGPARFMRGVERSATPEGGRSRMPSTPHIVQEGGLFASCASTCHRGARLRESCP